MSDMHVLRLDEQLANMDWPEAKAIDAPSIAPNSVLVMCAGFEDRALEVLGRALNRGEKNFRLLCVDYLPAVLANRRAEVEQLCRKRGITLESVTYDRENPASGGEKVLRAAGAASRLYIDISGMSRLLIVQLLAEVVRGGHLLKTEVLYVDAAEYPPSKHTVDAELRNSGDPVGLMMFLSAGVFGLTVVPELSSVEMQGQPIRVVAFPSWNPSQVAALCAEMQTSSFTVVNGIPRDEPDYWKLEAMRQLNRIDSLSPREEFSVSTRDYRDVLRLLLQIYHDHAQREKIVVSPTGSKMQSVAVGLVCGWLRDIQIAYPTPREFSPPDRYTRGIGGVYSLSFEACSALAAALANGRDDAEIRE
ncbi:hypothetical protein KRR26_35690 [Corallococcus sp. M34]|uniref:hypothetical protein n=1 Tax=Citreicoccus inhibens TaxID=2849499 RepID=UPI001C21FA24|nr:hypothetical protein [Citreicoccus inhibens]MBU8900953.1 hypothetical protein [Citreicoccus inhibens]